MPATRNVVELDSNWIQNEEKEWNPCAPGPFRPRRGKVAAAMMDKMNIIMDPTACFLPGHNGESISHKFASLVDEVVKPQRHDFSRIPGTNGRKINPLSRSCGFHRKERKYSSHALVSLSSIRREFEL